MARRRRSGFQDFADNFKSVYGTFSDLARDFEIDELMDEDRKFYDDTAVYGVDDEPVPLTGLDRDRARMRQIADVYTKYGDAKTGLQLRSSLAEAEGKELDTKYKGVTFRDRADKAAAESQSAQSKAFVAKNTQQTQVDAATAALEGQKLRNTGRKLTNEELQRQAELAKIAQPGLLAQAQIKAKDQVAIADTVNKSANWKELGAKSQIDYIMKAIPQLGLSPEARQTFGSLTEANQLRPVLARVKQISAEAAEALKTGGVQGVLKYYNENVRDGAKEFIRPIKGTDQYEFVRVDETGTYQLYKGSKLNAENFAFNEIQKPGTGISVAVDEANFKLKQAQIEYQKAAAKAKNRKKPLSVQQWALQTVLSPKSDKLKRDLAFTLLLKENPVEAERLIKMANAQEIANKLTNAKVNPKLGSAVTKNEQVLLEDLARTEKDIKENARPRSSAVINQSGYDYTKELDELLKKRREATQDRLTGLYGGFR